MAPWERRDVLDIGCGSGFHLPWFARTAATVTGVEPHAGLLALARRRLRSLPRDLGRAEVRVLSGTAQSLPLPPASVDVVHARWAYFFGPGCEPGLAEVARVLRRGGTAVVIDNDAGSSTFGRWFRTAYDVDPVQVERFWSTRGWQRRGVLTRWEMRTREDFAAVVRIEFDPRTADRILAEHDGTGVDYAVNLWWRRH